MKIKFKLWWLLIAGLLYWMFKPRTIVANQGLPNQRRVSLPSNNWKARNNYFGITSPFVYAEKLPVGGVLSAKIGELIYFSTVYLGLVAGYMLLLYYRKNYKSLNNFEFVSKYTGSSDNKLLTNYENMIYSYTGSETVFDDEKQIVLIGKAIINFETGQNSLVSQAELEKAYLDAKQILKLN